MEIKCTKQGLFGKLITKKKKIKVSARKIEVSKLLVLLYEQT